jgi:branched-subunit amino acid aminotransferase/4-amino-4-deoxychorismate lyase
LPGIIRGLLIKVAEENRLPLKVQGISPSQLNEAESIFSSNSLVGIQPFHQFIGKELNTHLPLFTQLKEAYDGYKKLSKGFM